MRAGGELWIGGPVQKYVGTAKVGGLADSVSSGPFADAVQEFSDQALCTNGLLSIPAALSLRTRSAIFIVLPFSPSDKNYYVYCAVSCTHTVVLLIVLRLNNYLFHETDKCDRFGKSFRGLPVVEIGRSGGRWKAHGELLLTMQCTFSLHACTLSPTTRYNARKT